MAERKSDGYFPEYQFEPRERSLSPPELQALSYASYGLTAEMAADVSGKSRHTVLGQLKSARGKLGAKNTTHAVALAFRAHLIE